MNNFPPAILDASNPASPLTIPLTNTALLLCDYHTFITSPNPNSPPVIEKTRLLRSWARANSVLVIHCSIDLRATTSLTSKMATRANAVREKTNLGTSDDSASSIGVLAGEFQFWRPPSCVSALGSYGLRDFLRQHGVRSLIVGGFSTSGCVVNSIKAAADEGFVVSVIRDACGDRSLEVHEFVMERMLLLQAHVAGWEEFEGAWKKEQGDGAVVERIERLDVGGS